MARGEPTEEPVDLPERIADAALEAAKAAAGRERVELEAVIVLVRLETDEPPNAATAAIGIGDNVDALAMLIGHTEAYAKALGMKLDFVPNLGPQGEG